MLNVIQLILLILIGCVNLYTFILYFMDKQKAKRHQYRIPEKKLLAMTFLLGGLGATFGMYALRHKTNHLKFQLGVPVALLITLAVLRLIVI